MHKQIGQLGAVALFSILSFAVSGCRTHTEATPETRLIRVKGKVGVIVTSKAEPWISRQLEVMSASKFFPGGEIVVEAPGTKQASEALASLKTQGCTFAVLLGNEDAFDGKALAESASKADIKAVSLHWRLPQKDGTLPRMPFVGIHDNQVGDSLAQTALKVDDGKSAMILFVGSVSRHPEFFNRAEATLGSKLDTKKSIHCDTLLGQPLDYYKAPVLQSLKGKSAKGTWIVIGYDDASALGAAKALTGSGASKVFAYGVGGSEPVIDAWEKDAPYALDGSVLLSPYPEVLALAKVLSKWEVGGSTPSKTQLGGAVIQKSNYQKLMKSMLQPSASDIS